MKKALAFLLISALVLSFSACGGERGADFASEEFLERYDFSQNWNHIQAGFCKSGDTACFYPAVYSNDRCIHFVLPETGEVGILCGKPECKHTDSSCNAYVYGLSPKGLCRYDERIYWLDEDPNDKQMHILSCAPDGTDRKVGAPLDSALYDKLSNDVRALFHRGYLYLCGENNAVSDAIPRYGSLVYCMPIDGSAEATIILDRQYPENVGVNQLVQAYRTGVYIAEFSYTVGSDAPYTLELYRWDTVTQTLETLLEQEISFAINEEMYITEDGILFSSYYSGMVYQYNFASGELALLFDFNAGGGTFSYVDFSSGLCVSHAMDEERRFLFRATDLTGKILFEATAEIPGYRESGFGVIFCGANVASLYYQIYFGRNGGGTYSELIAVDFATGGYRILWTDK